MPLDLASQNTWLKQNNRKVLLLEAVYHDGISKKVFYSSNSKYVTQSGIIFTDLLGNNVENISYDDNLNNIPSITSDISNSDIISSFNLLNTTGIYDDFLLYSWAGHKIRLLIGDSNWPRTKFFNIFDGIMTTISSNSPEQFSLNVRDKSEVLEVQLQENLITLSSIQTAVNAAVANGSFIRNIINDPSGIVDFSTTVEGNIPDGTIDRHIPICLGKVFNIEPVLIDHYNHIYWIHEGNIKSVDKVRSNGNELIGPNSPIVDTLSDPNLTPTNTTSYINNVTDNIITYDSTTGSDIDPPTINWRFQNGVIYSQELDEARLIIEVIDDKNFRVEYNAEGQTAEEAGWSNITGTIKWWNCTSTQGIYIQQYEVDLENGLLRLLDHPQDTAITCDVQGQATRGAGHDATQNLAQFSAAEIIEWIALEKIGLTIPEISYSHFTSINNAVLGYYTSEEVTIREVLEEIMASLGGFFRFCKCLGDLQLLVTKDPSNETPELYIDMDDIIEKTFSISIVEPPFKFINLGYKKNYKVFDRESIAGFIQEADNQYLLDSLTNEFINLRKSTGILEDQYPLAKEKEDDFTLFWEFLDADAELNRRLAIRNTKRFVYKLTTNLAPMTLNIGSIINITHDRFGFKEGRNALIIGFIEQLSQNRVELEVWL